MTGQALSPRRELWAARKATEVGLPVASTSTTSKPFGASWANSSTGRRDGGNWSGTTHGTGSRTKSRLLANPELTTIGCPFRAAPTHEDRAESLLAFEEVRSFVRHVGIEVIGYLNPTHETGAGCRPVVA